jgi:hypothetical protein
MREISARFLRKFFTGLFPVGQIFPAIPWYNRYIRCDTATITQGGCSVCCGGGESLDAFNKIGNSEVLKHIVEGCSSCV